MTTLRQRSMLLGGLRLLIGRPGPLLWTYAFNLAIALLFSLRLHAQLNALLGHSLAAERLNSAFDFGTLGAVFVRLGSHQPTSGLANYAGLPIYFAIYFLLVPGALFVYRVAAPGKLGILLSTGLCFFWRFVRITLITVLVCGLILGPLLAIQGAWTNHVNETVVGVSALYYDLAGIVIVLLVASWLRLYFDLVEVYTVQLDDRFHPNGKPDRRVRKVLLPALCTLWRNPRAWGSFVLLALLGVGTVYVTGRFAVLSLAQPRMWPQFLLLQIGIFVSLLTRFWQRAAETILAADNPLPSTLLTADQVDPQIVTANCSTVPAPPRPFGLESTARPLVTEAGVAYTSSEVTPPPAVRRGDSGIFRIHPPVEPPAPSV